MSVAAATLADRWELKSNATSPNNQPGSLRIFTRLPSTCTVDKRVQLVTGGAWDQSPSVVLLSASFLSGLKEDSLFLAGLCVQLSALFSSWDGDRGYKWLRGIYVQEGHLFTGFSRLTRVLMKPLLPC